MKLPTVSLDALVAVDSDPHRFATAAKEFMKRQRELCQFAFQISQECGWTEDQYSAAMTVCHFAFDALERQMAINQRRTN